MEEGHPAQDRFMEGADRARPETASVVWWNSMAKKGGWEEANKCSMSCPHLISTLGIGSWIETYSSSTLAQCDQDLDQYLFSAVPSNKQHGFSCLQFSFLPL